MLEGQAGLSLDILKMESWTHMGRTANMIIKDVIHVFASISKIVRILLMGPRNRERCQALLMYVSQGQKYLISSWYVTDILCVGQGHCTSVKVILHGPILSPWNNALSVLASRALPTILRRS